MHRRLQAQHSWVFDHFFLLHVKEVGISVSSVFFSGAGGGDGTGGVCWLPGARLHTAAVFFFYQVNLNRVVFQVYML